MLCNYAVSCHIILLAIWFVSWIDVVICSLQELQDFQVSMSVLEVVERDCFLSGTRKKVRNVKFENCCNNR